MSDAIVDLSKQITDFALETKKDTEEKLQSFSEAVDKKVEEKLEVFKREQAEAIELLKAETASKLAAPAVIQKLSFRSDIDRRLASQLTEFMKAPPMGGAKREIKLFESVDEKQHFDLQARNLNFASALTGSGDGKGGRVDYADFRLSKWFGNPLANYAREDFTTGSSWQWRFAVGRGGMQYGYTVDQTNTRGTVDTNVWQLPLKDFNMRVDVRSTFIADANAGNSGWEGRLTESFFGEQQTLEGLAMIRNNDQAGTGATVLTGGVDGPRGLDQYPIAGSPAFNAGAFVPAAYGTSGTSGATVGLHSLATVDAATTNAAGNTSNIQYGDIFNMMTSLPQQYWNEGLMWMVSPGQVAAIRNLRDNNGTPAFERMTPGTYPGYIGTLAGLPVIINRWIDPPVSAGTAATQSLYPLYLASWPLFANIVRSLSFNIQRYTETLPGSITWFCESRHQFSVADPFAGVRLRSTATGAALAVPTLAPGQ